MSSEISVTLKDAKTYANRFRVIVNVLKTLFIVCPHQQTVVCAG
jgi:hypothetical protein